MGLFSKRQETEKPESRPGGIDFETAAARVTAADVADPFEAESAEARAFTMNAIAEDPGDSFAIKPEWAIVAVKGCFYPAEKFIHPAYAVSDEEAARVGPHMQAFLQSLADKWMPAIVGRLANKYPEFTDLAGALAVLYYHKYCAVSKLIAEEEERAAAAKRVQGERVTEMPLRSEPEPEPEERIVGQRLKDGSLVI